MGPKASAAAATANAMGPSFFLLSTADTPGLAHSNMQKLLLMVLHGPIIFYMVHCQCTRMGLLAFVLAAADGFV
jgi:hypothetical protein